MRTYRLYQIDAFTSERFAGNSVGVVRVAGRAVMVFRAEIVL